MTVLLLFQQTGYSEQAITDSASRIISLDLCTDWMLLKHADRSQVIAFSPLLYRFRVDWIPDGLPIHDGSLEQIVVLDPDLVVSGEFNALLLRKRLKQLGKRIEIMPLPQDIDSIQHYVNRFHVLLKTERQANKPFFIDRKNSKLKKLLLLGANGIGTGRGTLEHDVIEKSGWNNYIQNQGYVNLDLEHIVNDPPDAVLWSSPVSNSLANLFAQHVVLNRLIDKQNWFSNDYWRWQCPGPWTYDLISELASWEKP